MVKGQGFKIMFISFENGQNATYELIGLKRQLIFPFYIIETLQDRAHQLNYQREIWWTLMKCTYYLQCVNKLHKKAGTYWKGP